MKRAVIRYELHLSIPTRLTLPYGSTVRHVSIEKGAPYVYIEHTVPVEEAPGSPGRAELIVVGTGETRTDLLDYEFVGSATDTDGSVEHFFYRFRANPEPPVDVEVV